MENVYILSIARTAIGAFGGQFASLSAIDLGKAAVQGAITRAGISADQVDEVILGNVLQANLGQAPAKQVALASGIPDSVPCTTINKVCASGMKAIMNGVQAIQCKDADIIVAGGFESMSNTPFYIPKGRFGYKYGNAALIDGIVRDGLQDPYNGEMMGNAGEHCASECNISREDQDDFAQLSYERATAALESGQWDSEIIPVAVPQRRGDDVIITTDEEIGKANFEKMRKLRPAFKKDGTITAANASKLNDGAAAVILISESKLKEIGGKPVAKISGYADASQEPIWFTTTPSKAMPKAIAKAGLTIDDIDYFEINEAFSCVPLVNAKELGINMDKVDVFGGAVSLGHPIGCSGARIVVTLANVLQQHNAKYGCAGICNGGGGASAMVIERIE